MPICTETGVPPTSIVVLPFRYQPSEPVENSLTSACKGISPILTVTGLAFARNSSRLIGQVVFFAITSSGMGTWIPNTQASYHAPVGVRQGRFRRSAAFAYFAALAAVAMRQ